MLLVTHAGETNRPCIRHGADMLAETLELLALVRGWDTLYVHCEVFGVEIAWTDAATIGQSVLEVCRPAAESVPATG